MYVADQVNDKLMQVRCGSKHKEDTELIAALEALANYSHHQENQIALLKEALNQLKEESRVMKKDSTIGP